jgi:pilus assembly protein CpaF
VSGGAGSGKTTLLGILSAFIPDDERLITIEDAAELRLAKPHVVSLEARPANVEGRGEVTVRDLVRNALRMRPDRIIVGEVRGSEALDMLQAMNTGHEGSLSTAPRIPRIRHLRDDGSLRRLARLRPGSRDVHDTSSRALTSNAR